MLSGAAGGVPFNGGFLMQRNSVISLRPLVDPQKVLLSACADAQAAYGCVDWYQYSSTLDRAAAAAAAVAVAAGATVTNFAQAVPHARAG